jgi:hypothetical protein
MKRYILEAIFIKAGIFLLFVTTCAVQEGYRSKLLSRCNIIHLVSKNFYLYSLQLNWLTYLDR